MRPPAQPMSGPRITGIVTLLTSAGLLFSLALQAIPLVQGNTWLELLLAAPVLAVLYYVVIRFLTAYRPGWNAGQPSRPCVTDTDPSDDDEDVSEVRRG